MNYEEKYKQALERAKDLHDNHPLGQPQTWMICVKFFPELRESEDEMIRKELLEHCINRRDGKQICVDASDYRRWAAWLEKQGGQKPTDEVKPKFKIGDWITNGEYTWKVTDIKPLDYILQSQNGNVVDDTVSYVDEHFHLWTIQDAKEDYDLLAFIDSLPEEPASEDLEEAAKHCLYAILYDDVYVGNPTEEDCIRCFKVGAEWQKERDYLQYSHIRLKDIKDAWQTLKKNKPDIESYPPICFMKGAEWQKQQMMKDAVKTIMQYDDCDDLVPTFTDMSKRGFKENEKVYVIIIKEDNQ